VVVIDARAFSVVEKGAAVISGKLPDMISESAWGDNRLLLVGDAAARL
jgi:hypothetical protein